MPTSMTESLTPAAACRHDFEFARQVRESGNGFIVRTVHAKCKLCGEVLVRPGKNGYQTSWDEPLIPLSLAQTAPAAKAAPPEKKPQTLREQIGNGPGTELAEELERLGVSSCQACKAQAVVMNANGAEWCIANVDALVADILPRARAWADHTTLQEKMALWWQSDMSLMDKLKSGAKAATWQLDESLKVAIRSRVLAAVERWKATND